MKPTNIQTLYILAGIATTKIRRLIAAQKERYIQLADGRHMLYGYLECKKTQTEELLPFPSFGIMYRE